MLSKPNPAPVLDPSAPMILWIAGFSVLIIESIFFEVTPYSSASIITFKDHLTTSSHAESPSLTTGPNGSFDIVSGKTTCSSGFFILVLCAARPDLSVVYVSHLPESYAATTSSAFSKTTGS